MEAQVVLVVQVAQEVMEAQVVLVVQVAQEVMEVQVAQEAMEA